MWGAARAGDAVSWTGERAVVQLLQLLGPYLVWLYPIGIVVLVIYLRGWLTASRDLRASLFSLERESAIQRMRRAATGAFCTFGVLAAMFFVQFFVASTIDWSAIIRPTATPGFSISPIAHESTPEATATPDPRTPSATPSPTRTRRPTLPYYTPTPAEAAVTPLPPVAPGSCPTVGVQITWPRQAARVSGHVEIRGTASIANFDYYKIELGLGDSPNAWTSISEPHRSPVSDGPLDVLDTTGLPAGTYSIRLVVVDVTGNYPPPCEVRIVVGQ